MTVTLYYLGVCVSGERGGGGRWGLLDISTAECVVKLLHSIHLKANSEKHIHNMTTIFNFYDRISFNDLP